MKALILKTPDYEKALAFFTELGLKFVQEKHGSGPVHHACEQNGVLFEIYPARKTDGVLFKDFD